MTVSQQLFAALNNAFSRKYNSLAQYLIDARPYIAPGQEPAFATIMETAAEDLKFADRSAAVIEQLEGVPQLAIFNPEIASLNYLALDYLVSYMRQDLEGQLAEYESALPLAAEVPTASQFLQDLIAATRRQLERLK